MSYDRVSLTEKRFSMIGVTVIDGSPVMCILIISQKVKNLSSETGIDNTIILDGNPKDSNNYFFNNSGAGKAFCGKEVTQKAEQFLQCNIHKRKTGFVKL